MNRGLARWGVGILPARRRERDAPETAGKMPALHTQFSVGGNLGLSESQVSS